MVPVKQLSADEFDCFFLFVSLVISVLISILAHGLPSNFFNLYFALN